MCYTILVYFRTRSLIDTKISIKINFDHIDVNSQMYINRRKPTLDQQFFACGFTYSKAANMDDEFALCWNNFQVCPFSINLLDFFLDFQKFEQFVRGFQSV